MRICSRRLARRIASEIIFAAACTWRKYFGLAALGGVTSPQTGGGGGRGGAPLPFELSSRRRLIALVDCGGSILPSALLGLQSQHLELHLLGLGSLLLFPLQPLFQVFLS